MTFEIHNTMKYLGSKARIANDILPIMLNDTPMDEWMNTAWNGLREMKKELLELKGVVETHGTE